MISEQKRNILVVEDETLIAWNIKSVLEQLDYEVAAIAKSGEEAIREAEKIKPDLVLMDINLNGEMDGVETASEIKKLLDIPVIFITAYSDEEIIGRAKLIEPYGYIFKPFDERELLTNIEIALYNKKMEGKIKQSEK